MASLGFGLLAMLWIATTLSGWRAAVARKFRLHRAMLRLSFAMTFGAATLRLQIPIGFIFSGFHSYSAMSPWLSFTAWVLNVLLTLPDLAATARRRVAALGFAFPAPLAHEAALGLSGKRHARDYLRAGKEGVVALRLDDPQRQSPASRR